MRAGGLSRGVCGTVLLATLACSATMGIKCQGSGLGLVCRRSSCREWDRAVQVLVGGVHAGARPVCVGYSCQRPLGPLSFPFPPFLPPNAITAADAT